mgnify:CR=1 FL=1
MGRAGDGFICTSGKGMDLYTEKLLPAVAEGAAKAERDVAQVDKMIEGFQSGAGAATAARPGRVLRR